MGLLDWLFGRKGGGRRRPRGLAEPEVPDILDEDDALDASAYPLTAEFRVRSRDYNRLRTPWRQMTMNNAQEWEAAKDTMFEEFFRRYAFYRTLQGQMAPRWNNKVWQSVRARLPMERR